MKDFYDVWVLFDRFEFQPDRLVKAIGATFERRKTPIPTDFPDALSPDFAGDESKQRQWTAFIRELEVEAPPLHVVTAELARRLMPLARSASALSKGRK